MSTTQPIGRWNALPSGFFRVHPGGATVYVASDVGNGAYWWVKLAGKTLMEGRATDEVRAMSVATLLMLRDEYGS